MRRTSILAVLSVVLLFTLATTTLAQMGPGYRRHSSSYGGYGYDSATVIYNLDSAGNASRAAAESRNRMGEQAAMQQQAALQGNIRNTMAADSQQRMQGILGQQQAGRDWWFQVEQQQMAQRRAQTSSFSGAMAPVAGFESAPASDMPEAALDIIKWLPVLRGPFFADQRTRIEAPYRRSAKGLSSPTADDYKDMIEAADEMKATLKKMAAGISAQDYLNADAFLDQLIAEVRERLEKRR